MKAALHSYNTGHFFNATARLYGWLATVFAILAISNGAMVAFLFLPLGVLFQFTYSRVEIDLENRTYKAGALLLGFTIGRLKHLQGVDFLYLNKNNHMQLARTWIATARFRSVKYDGFLKLADNTKLHLVQESSKEKALQKMERISDDLGIELRDQTDMKFY
ncbi:hypothetical protein WG947_12560 [Pontibacter sp. H259]|uniref:hypothetical protein n=1 Tax=Pontibacter sp. H259 TaxID=3133421 RepID=UPI0030C3AB78